MPRVLTFSTLYPSVVRPRHGIFVETRLRKLLATGQVEARVVAPVPWFPFEAEAFGDYALYARTPREETRHGVHVLHPRYFMAPGIGMHFQPDSLAVAAGRAIGRLLREGFDFDVIDAHYFYPDGVAAAALARRFQRPFVVTARGSDINLVAGMRGPRRRIVQSAREAAHVFAVSSALKKAIVALGVEGDRVSVLRNGVDLELFQPADQATARRRLGLGAGPVIASVGNLVPEKGHDLVLRACALLPGATAIVVGDGGQRDTLESLATSLGIADRVRFFPAMPQADLAGVYSAADVLALGSLREGWPNVLLESMACGTPVVTMAVGGAPEVVAGAPVGIAVDERDPGRFADALKTVLTAANTRTEVRAYASGFGWDAVSAVQARLFTALAARCDSRRDRGGAVDSNRDDAGGAIPRSPDP